MKSFTTTNNKGAGKLAKISNELGRTVRYTFSVFSLMAMTAYGSELHAQNSAPTDVLLTSTDINELQPVGTAVGYMTSVDPDAGDTFTYSLVAGIGDDDNASFSILLNKLQSEASYDYVAKNSYNIRIATTDAGGLSFEKAITVSIKHLPPVVTDLADVVTNGQVYSFHASEFTSSFSVPNGMALNTAKIISLPTEGELDLSGTPVTAGQILTAADLDNLSYVAPTGFAGIVTMDWNATDALGTYADNAAQIKMSVKRSRNIGGVVSVDSIVGFFNNNDPGGSGHIRIGTSLDGDSIHTAGTLGSGTGTIRGGTPTDPNSLNRMANPASIAGIEESNTAPEILIHNCYPNPFSNGATIKYQLPKDGKVEIKVFNSAGAEIKSLINESQTAGVHGIEWNGKNNAGVTANAGQYYYFITVKDAAGNQLSTNSGVMVKL